MNKRVFAVVLILCLLFSLSACKSKKGSPDLSTESSVEMSSGENATETSNSENGSEADSSQEEKITPMIPQEKETIDIEEGDEGSF